MAHAAAPLRPMVHGVRLFSLLAARRGLGDDSQRSAGAGAYTARTGCDTERGESGQPIGEVLPRGLRGYGANKKVMGRKRHLLVDAQGFALNVVAHALQVYGPGLPRLSTVWADGGYSGPLADELRDYLS